MTPLDAAGISKESRHSAESLRQCHGGSCLRGLMLRVRGRAWLLSILWVGLGAAESGYVFLVSTQPPAFPNNFQVATWVGEPGLITGAGELAGVAWLVLTIPVLVAGLIRLRGWRPGQGLRAAAWAGAWAAGFALMVTVEVWQAPATCGEYGCPPIDHAVVSWIELPICAAFLALGAAMTRILAVPAHGWDVPDTTGRSYAGQPGQSG
jgi:hypothetical protein